MSVQEETGTCHAVDSNHRFSGQNAIVAYHGLKLGSYHGLYESY